MNQRTHTWLAIRALALMDDTGEAEGLLKILKPYVKSSAIGSWIPDMLDSKKGSGDIDNHVMKMKPYNGELKKRFILKKKDLLKKLGPKRHMYHFIKEDTMLKDTWWSQPYKAEPQPGQHLANRSMALTITLIDQLILGDKAVAKLVPGTVRFAGNLDPNARTRKEEIATYFFMLSHFVADSCMPCHCDARSLAAYSNGLHTELESHWSKKIGTYFDKKKLLKSNASSRKILDEARKVDKCFDITFPDTVPAIRARDVWEEIVMVCRGAFAVSNIMANPEDYPHNGRKKASFERLFGDDNGKSLLEKIDKVVMHDAVLNIAIVWKHVWETF